MVMRFKKNLGIGALLCLLPTLAFAHGWEEGVWKGSIHKGGHDVGVHAQFTPNGAELIFDGAFTCRVKARYDKADGDALVYKFSEAEVDAKSKGKVCYDLVGNILELTHAAGDDALTLDFVVPARAWEGRWKGQLERDPDYR
ncbi:hypothetical protein J2T07_000604 [Luteibacter jiangsuensis]|uniref:Uncharacterized protein n=1 Tax=Luteibacter jiangsuensis TaxID=637577 RepID=A0ABT9STX2_9GAMM|nr:hypothetical protein [Luteibacter jiangsuensis]MDQ0008445.1 hypothetical protein [Luteibacter jiangsuensis]